MAAKPEGLSPGRHKKAPGREAWWNVRRQDGVARRVERGIAIEPGLGRPKAELRTSDRERTGGRGGNRDLSAPNEPSPRG